MIVFWPDKHDLSCVGSLRDVTVCSGVLHFFSGILATWKCRWINMWADHVYCRFLTDEETYWNPRSQSSKQNIEAGEGLRQWSSNIQTHQVSLMFALIFKTRKFISFSFGCFQDYGTGYDCCSVGRKHMLLTLHHSELKYSLNHKNPRTKETMPFWNKPVLSATFYFPETLWDFYLFSESMAFLKGYLPPIKSSLQLKDPVSLKNTDHGSC